MAALLMTPFKAPTVMVDATENVDSCPDANCTEIYSR